MLSISSSHEKQTAIAEGFSTRRKLINSIGLSGLRVPVRYESASKAHNDSNRDEEFDATKWYLLTHPCEYMVQELKQGINTFTYASHCLPEAVRGVNFHPVHRDGAQGLALLPPTGLP